MRGTHEPRDEFVDRLEGQIRAEMRRQNRAIHTPRWTQWLQSPIKAAVTAAVLMGLSMAVGGLVVAHAYQAQTNQQRSALVAAYEERGAIARQRVVLNRDELQTAQQRVSLGIDRQNAVVEARFKVVEAEARLRSIESQLAEVRLTGREPLDTVSAPAVSGQDFVSDRWRIDMSVSEAAFDLEKARLQDLERRFQLGLATALDVEASRARIAELEAALAGFRLRLDIRQQFLKREIDAALAGLRVLESDAEQRRQALVPRIALARKTVQDLTIRVDVGTAQRVELAEAQLRFRELELESSKVDVDLAVIQRQIAQRRTGR
jgi:hypothetical protein